MKIKTLVFPLFGISWGVLIVLGTLGMSDYARIPGATGQAPLMWPVTSTLQKTTNTATLIVFFHPECACSFASAEELDRIMAHAPQETQVYSVFVRPAGWSDEQLKQKLWNRVTAIPRIIPVIDSQSKEAKTFGAETSGHTVLYGAHGNLLFSGGITGSRGHTGANKGQLAVAEILQNSSAHTQATDTFGCRLSNAPLKQFSQLLSRWVPSK